MAMEKRLFQFGIILLFFPLTVFAEEDTLTIAVAANLASAISEINETFENSHPGVEVRTTIGSSGALTAQILNGAPLDVFLAADMKYPERIDAQGGAAQPPQLYALGKLVLVSRVQYFPETVENFLLGSEGPVIIPNPRVAPYGVAALEFLQAAGLQDAIESRLAYTENISQTVRMILATDGAGFISKSTLLSLKEKEKKSSPYVWFEIDPALYSPIRQGAVITIHGSDNPWAGKYLDFLIRGEGRVLLSAFGYKIENE